MDDQCRVAVFHRPLQPDLSGERHGPEVVEVEDDQREAGTTGEQIGGAQRRAETACTLHPEQRGEVVIRAMRARSRLLPPEDRGPTISLSRPGGNSPSRPSIPSRSHPGGGEDSIGIAMPRFSL
jgi:hypothetical protein